MTIRIAAIFALVTIPAFSQGWASISSTRLDAVCPSPSPGGASGCSSVVQSWSSAVVDTKRNRLIVFGGGHNDYWGNEVYALSLTGTPSWSRLTNPSTAATSCPGFENADGTPRSLHTYDGLVYMPVLDAMLVFSGSPAPCGSPFSRLTWLFHFATNTWEKVTPDAYNAGTTYALNAEVGHVGVHYRSLQNSNTGNTPASSPTFWEVIGYDPGTTTSPAQGAYCAYNVVDQHAYCVDGDNFLLMKFSESTKRWTKLTNYPTTVVGTGTTAEIDPVDQRMWFMGGVSGDAGSTLKVQSIDLNPGSTYAVTDHSASVTGCTPMTDTQTIYDHPGWSYDPARNVFVGYPGKGKTVYTFHPDLGQCVQQEFASGPDPTPTPSAAGTFGRFSYVPAAGKYIFVGSVSQNAWWFTLDKTSVAGMGASTVRCKDRDGDGYGVGPIGTPLLTDLVIDSVSNTKISSAARPFTAADVGTYVTITGGTGFTVGQPKVNRFVATNGIKDVTITSGGQGYKFGSYNIPISGSPGTGAAWLIVDVNGAISSVSTTSFNITTGSGFTAGSTLTTSAFDLTQLTNIPAWSSGTTYSINTQVIYSGVTYKALQSSNTNHQPDTSPTWWDDQGAAGGANLSYTVNLGPPLANLTTAAGTAGSTGGSWNIPGCIGYDGDDLDAEVWTTSHLLTKYGTVQGALRHLGYNPTRICYISPTGNNATGACDDETKPYLTYGGIPSVAGGTAVVYRAGTHSGGFSNARIIPPVSGSMGAPIIHVNYPGERVMMNGTLYQGDDIGYVVVDGFSATGCSNQCVSPIGTGRLASSPFLVRNNIFKNIEVYNSHWGMLGRNMADVTVEDSVMRNSAGEHGLYFGSRLMGSERVHIRRNLAFDNPYTGIQINGICRWCTVDQNIIYRNGIAGLSLENGVQRSFVRNNISWANNSGGIVVSAYNSFEGDPLIVPPGNTGAATSVAICGASGTDPCTCSPPNEGSSCPNDQNYNTYERNVLYHNGLNPNGAPVGSAAINISYQNRNRAVFSAGYCSTVACLAVDQGSNTFRNNILIGSGTGGWYPGVAFADTDRTFLSTSVYTDNHFYLSDGNTTRQTAVGYPVGSNATTHTCAAAASLTSMSGCQFGNPLFIAADKLWYDAPSLYDWRPQTSSPVLAAGGPTTTQYDIVGTFLQPTQSIGAYEVTAESGGSSGGPSVTGKAGITGRAQVQ